MYPLFMFQEGESLPIYSPLLGQNVGYLKLTLGLGSPVQVNRQIEKENEQMAAEEAKRPPPEFIYRRYGVRFNSPI